MRKGNQGELGDPKSVLYPNFNCIKNKNITKKGGGAVLVWGDHRAMYRFIPDDGIQRDVDQVSPSLRSGIDTAAGSESETGAPMCSTSCRES